MKYSHTLHLNTPIDGKKISVINPQHACMKVSCVCVCLGLDCRRERKEMREFEERIGVGGFCQCRSRHPMRYHCIVLVVSYTEAGRSTRINKKLLCTCMYIHPLSNYKTTNLLVIRGVSYLSLCTTCFGLFKLPTCGTLRIGRGHSTCSGVQILHLLWSPDLRTSDISALLYTKLSFSY